ncbi:MAG: N-acetylmuramic acid 6-phosphate etherase, partial [Sporomusaceae bacterium]|nr:N-acetylmuramic acid 6-phosphate etherase [Sporomusaceae bacterium]
ATMISLGKVYSNLMVDLQATNHKLQERAKRIVALAANISLSEADKALQAAHGSAKLAILMVLTGLDREPAIQLLKKNKGFIAASLEANKV